MADSTTFFNRLKKIFSKETIVTVDKDGNRNVFDIDRSQIDTNLSQLRDRYTKLHRTYTEQYGQNMSMAYQQIRREIFKDYDSMDQDPIISSALDIFSDESCLKNEYGDVLTINSDNDKIKDTLENLFYDVLNIEFNIWPWIRNLTKYGDTFLVLEVSPEYGIISTKPYSVYGVERLENHDPKFPALVQFKIEGGEKDIYDAYEIAHFRLLSDTNFLPYGKSMIENARRLWKQLSLMEDAMMIHRIMRAPEKRLFKIDIGNIPANEIDNYMQRIINKMKKIPFVDKKTGDYNLKYNIQNLTEDFYLPVRGGDSGTNIETIGGLDYSAIEDIDYLKAKLFAALKIPKAYLGYEEDISGKATIAAEDVRFARTIERIQKVVESELTKIAIIHLISIGVKEEELAEFTISLTNPSTIYEQEKISLWSEKVRLADDMKRTRMFSTDWIYKNVFKLSDDEMDIERVNLVTDLKNEFRYETISQQGEDPAQPDDPTDVEAELDELKKEITSTNKGGRPKEGSNYRRDDNPFGRDPLGDEENHSNTGLERPNPEVRKLNRQRTKRTVESLKNNIPLKKKLL